MDKRQKILFTAFLLSLIIHIIFFWIMDRERWLFYSAPSENKPTPEEVTFIFPENKPVSDQPREIVQNMNETEEVPDNASLLSEKKSRARNPEQSGRVSDIPRSSGNTPFSNLSANNSRKSFRMLQNKKFNKSALKGTSYKTQSELYREQQNQNSGSSESQGSNQMMNQEKFSVENIGALTLSTYKWNWAPYINKMKNKLVRVWFAPAAYYKLGLISGQTAIKFTISRQGDITELVVLDHKGHAVLEGFSTSAIKALFPFLPLPEDFPDETLTIIAKLVYPDLRSRRP